MSLEKTENIEKEKTYHVYCAGGYRSVIFIYILKSIGYKNLIDIKGGYSSLKKTNLPKKQESCG